MSGTGLLGGTFNPVHTGHIRHALEVGEALELDRVLLTPCAVPPHKSGLGLLPFELRVELIRAAVEGVERLGVNTLEGELSGPSYTFVSLQAWNQRRKAEWGEPYFLLGVEDFAALHSWYRGAELPLQAHLVVVPRAGSDRALFFSVIRRLWPKTNLDGLIAGSDFMDDVPPGRVTVELAEGGLCTFLPVPRLDISASFVRSRWLEGRDLHGLVPEKVRTLLDSRRFDVDRIWKEQEHGGMIPLTPPQ